MTRVVVSIVLYLLSIQICESGEGITSTKGAKVWNAMLLAGESVVWTGK